MAMIAPDLWLYNFVRVIFVDVSRDYEGGNGFEPTRDPMPSHFYPTIRTAMLPLHRIESSLQDPSSSQIEGYRYEWHEPSDQIGAPWYVGVAKDPLAKTMNPAAKRRGPAP